MQSRFVPTSQQSLHVGTKRASTTLSWEEWYKRYTPEYVRCLLYKKEGDTMKDLRVREFRKKSFYDRDSVVQCHRDGYSIIMLEWRDPDLDSKANSFLNNFLPIAPSQRFHDGIVGIGVGRWLKALFMMSIIKTGNDQETVRVWFHDLVKFSGNLIAMKNGPQWFDVIRTTLRTNDSVEDILVLRLMQAIMGVTVTRQRTFRWFEVSLQRAFKHDGHLKTSMLTPMVWFYTHLLIDKDLPDKEAFSVALERLMGLPHYEDLEIVRFLVGEIFPELGDKAADILKSVRARTPWTDTMDTVFSDGSVIGRALVEIPYGIRTIARGGTITIAPGTGDTFLMSTAEYNHYTPFMIRLPETGTEVRVTVTGRVIAPDQTSRYGPGVVCRALGRYATSGKDFMGRMGLSLVGGRGDGRSAPTAERKKPSFLLKPPSSDHETKIATIELSSAEYSLTSEEWETPMTMTIGKTDTVFAIFVKGFTDLKIRVEPRVRIPTPAPAATATAATPTITGTPCGVRFSDLVHRAKTMT